MADFRLTSSRPLEQDEDGCDPGPQVRAVFIGEELAEQADPAVLGDRGCRGGPAGRDVQGRHPSGVCSPAQEGFECLAVVVAVVDEPCVELGLPLTKLS